MFALILVPAVLLASQVAAVASPEPVSVTLFARQSSPAIPDQCKSDCNDTLNVGAKCTSGDVTCLCSEAIGASFVQCGNCLAKQPEVPATVISGQQQALDNLTSTCQSAGHPFKQPLKINGTSSSSSSGSSPSAAPPKSAALSVSPGSAFAVLSIVGGLFALVI